MVRKCSRGIGDFAIMEVAQVGVTTRSRAALAMSSPAVVSSRPGKRRKVENGEFVKLSNSYVELRRRREVVIESENLLNSGEDKVDCGRTIMEVECSSPSSDHVQASCCSSNGSSELDAEEDRIKFVDLEVTKLNSAINSVFKILLNFRFVEN